MLKELFTRSIVFDGGHIDVLLPASDRMNLSSSLTKSITDIREGNIASIMFAKEYNCGANAKGGHGFQPGNTCGADEAGGSVTSERQTDTKAFKKWFGNSKIVNEDGTPRVVYHGTGAEFDEFARSGARLTSIGTGYYFSPDPDVASAYAVGDNPHVKPVYLRAENMLDWESLSDSDRSKITEHLQSVVPAERLAGFGIVKREFPRDADNEAEEFYKKKKEETKHLYHDRSKARVDFDKEKTVISWMEPGLASATDSNLKSLAQEYDQEIAKRLGYDSARNGNEIVVFDRKQIKSATGNSGAYSLDDAGISKSFQTTAQAFFARDWDETKYVRHGKGDERGGEFAPKGGGDSTDDKIIQKVVQHLYDYDNGERDAYDKATALMPEEPSDELRKGVETALADKHLEAKGGKDAVMKQLVELRTNELIALYNDDNQAEIKAKDEAHNITKNVYAAKDFGGKWIGEHVHEAVMQHIKDNHETVSDDLVNGLLKSSLNRNDRTYLFDKPGMSDVLNIVQDRAEERAKDAGVDIDTLFTQRSEFTELPRPEDDDGTWFKKISALTDEWDSNAKRAVSLGVISPEVAMAHGFYPTGGEVYKHMPEELYTVTTAVDAVMNSKLKTRDELGQRNGAGLGGGSSDTISFTHDPEIAVQIKESIREAGRVARGEITRQQMVDAADKNLDIRTGKELYGTFKDQFRYVFSRGELEDKLSDTKRDGTPKTEEEIRYDAFDVYKKYAFIRENHGGPIDPLFFSADLDAIARMPLEQVQIIKAKMKPTSRGYQVSALGEWRVHTGDTVSDMSVMNDDRDENSSKSAALAKSLGCLYMFRDSSRQTAVNVAQAIFTRAASDCGANTDGGHGFQPGNTCGGEGGSGGGSSTSTGDKKGTGRKLREAFYGTKKDHAEVLAKADEKHIAKNEEDPETARAVKETFTTPEQKKQYTKVIKDTLDKLPPMMSDVIARNVKDIKFCSKVEEVGYLANKAKPPKGVYGFFRPGSGELVLNGGPKSDEQNPEAKALTQHGIYAHEMAHAADRIGNGNTFSASKSWAEAYAHEINRDDVPLSNYARQNAQEGFAEFVRLMATNPELTKQKFPKSAKAVQSVYGRF